MPHPSRLVRVPTEPLEDWHHRKQLIEPASTARASLPRTYPAHELQPAHESSETDQAAPATYTLKLYLEESWFPAFKIGPRVQQAFIWPHYPELQAPPGTRKLRAISRISPKRIHGAVCEYLARQKDKQILRPASGDCRDLALPSINLVNYDDKDVMFYLQDVNFVTDITRILLVSVLRTVARSLYMLLDIPEGEDGDLFRSLVQFKTSFGMCPVKDMIFDVVSLGSFHPGRTSMIILIVPPWALDNMDLISFINTGPVPPGSLDAFPAGEPTSPPIAIWAMLWDMCSRHKCSYFAVTTYEFWVFGNFTSTMEDAYVSDLFGAPVHPHDVQIRRHTLRSPSMTETVLFWMAASMGIEGIDWVPFDDKAT